MDELKWNILIQPAPQHLKIFNSSGAFFLLYLLYNLHKGYLDKFGC